jgi:hypothetical protein
MAAALCGAAAGVLAYVAVEAVQAALRALHARESTRPSGLGCETRRGGSAGRPGDSCWCGNSLTDSPRRAHVATQIRRWCAECGRWN